MEEKPTDESQKKDSFLSFIRKSAINYNEAERVKEHFSLDTFFLQNEIPTVRTYQSLESFKNGILSLSERLYRDFNDFTKKKYFTVLMDEDLSTKKVSKKFKKCLKENSIRFLNSKVILLVFRGYFNLFQYHYPTIRSYPEIFDDFLDCIITIFGSLKKKRLEFIIKEASHCPAMLGFYMDLYSIYVSEGKLVEKACMFQC